MEDRASKLNRAQRFIHVPDTWEGWALRIMTVALVIVFVAVYVLLGKLADLEVFIAESRVQRTTFQQQELARQCTILSLLGSSRGEMEKLRC